MTSWNKVKYRIQRIGGRLLERAAGRSSKHRYQGVPLAPRRAPFVGKGERDPRHPSRT